MPLLVAEAPNEELRVAADSSHSLRQTSQVVKCILEDVGEDLQRVGLDSVVRN